MNPAQQTHRLLSSAATVNATSVTTSATTLRGVMGFNARASAVYLKLYNKGSAPDENDTPRKTIYLPASTAFELRPNDFFGAGLAYRMTTAGADNSTAAVAAGDILALNLDYI